MNDSESADVSSTRGQKDTVCKQWIRRLNQPEMLIDALQRLEDQSNTLSIQAFIEAFKDELNLQDKQSGSGSHYQLPKAIEKGIAAVIKKQFDVDRDSETFARKFDIITKTSDISFTFGDRHLVFEVKTALEFNALAAAGAEAVILKGDQQHEEVTFVLFSLAGKGGYNSEKATGIAKRIFPESIDKVFVLSLEAGRAKQQCDKTVLEELVAGLDDFSTYLEEWKNTSR